MHSCIHIVLFTVQYRYSHSVQEVQVQPQPQVHHNTIHSKILYCISQYTVLSLLHDHGTSYILYLPQSNPLPLADPGLSLNLQNKHRPATSCLILLLSCINRSPHMFPFTRRFRSEDSKRSLDAMILLHRPDFPPSHRLGGDRERYQPSYQLHDGKNDQASVSR